jgi:hypothetical protein
MWVVTGKAIEVGLSKSVETYILSSHCLMLDTELQDLMYALLGFRLALVPSLLSVPPFPLFWNWECLLCCCILEVCKLFDLQRLKTKSLP